MWANGHGANWSTERGLTAVKLVATYYAHHMRVRLNSC